MESQGLLFTEPSIAETGVWCKLADGIDPAQWASLAVSNRRCLNQKFPFQAKKAFSFIRFFWYSICI